MATNTPKTPAPAPEPETPAPAPMKPDDYKREQEKEGGNKTISGG